MIKNLFLIIFICILVHSCGKKGDPVYNKENQNTKISINQTSRSS
tara:strand:+ start:329 stop:463 length:135 start_codon:yes stop_codon:yes gene_type:complete